MQILRILSFGLVLAAFLTGSPAIQAQVISINFGADQASLEASDVTGVIPVANWNNASGATGTLTNLVDDSGAATAASVTWSASNTWQAASPYPTNPTQVLLYGYLDGGSNGVPAQVSVQNIPFNLYDVYIYVNRDNDDSTSTYTVNGQTVTITPGIDQTTLTPAGVATPASPDPTTAGTWVEFTDLSGPLSILTSNGNLYQGSGDWRSPIDGIQIVDAAVPEPSTYAFMGLGLLLILALRSKVRISRIVRGRRVFGIRG